MASDSGQPKKGFHRSLRLPGYDYAQPGGYFVTICVDDRTDRFGPVVDGLMAPNAAGAMIAAAWQALPARFPGLELDEFVVMPNHLHGILLITAEPDAAGCAPLGEIVGAFKSITTVAYAAGVREQGWPRFAGVLWQKNYYEHVLRNLEALRAIRQYIADNPAQWALDPENQRRPAGRLRRDSPH